MPLTPHAIYNDLKNNFIDKASAVELLITLIENVDNLTTRIDSIETLEKIKIKNKKVFKTLENLIVSASSENIRMVATKVLKNIFQEKAITPLKWAIQHEKSLNCLITITKNLGEIKGDQAKSVLIKEIYNINNREFKYNIENLIHNKELETLSNSLLAGIIITYFLISSLKLKFGYINYDINTEGVLIGLDLSNVDNQGFVWKNVSNYLEAIFSHSFLIRLDLSNNHLTTIPERVNRLDKLEYLDLSFNNISQLPGSITAFTNLKTLSLKSNHLKNLPPAIGAISTLESLKLRSNLIKSLPETIGSLNLLKILDLHHNQINRIQESLGALNSLEMLELGWNQIESIPDSLLPSDPEKNPPFAESEFLYLL